MNKDSSCKICLLVKDQRSNCKQKIVSEMFLDYKFWNAVLISLAVSIVLIYFYVKRLFSYWQRRGVSQLRPSFPFGDFGKVLRQKLSFNEQIDEWYHNTTEPFLGVYIFFQRQLIARDPELVRNILVKDFQYFVDRVIPVDEKNYHLFALKGDEWKNLRTKLTPTFTSGKMKAIFTTLLELKGPLLEQIERMANSSQAVECYKLASSHIINGSIRH